MKSTKYSIKIMTQKAEKYLTHEFLLFCSIVPHDLSHFVGIACFSFTWNLLLSFFVRHDLKF